MPAPSPSPDDVVAEPILANGDSTGTVVSNGAHNLTQATARVGAYQELYYFEYAMKVSFDLGALPEGAEVTSATLAVQVVDVVGAVYQLPMEMLVAGPVEKDAATIPLSPIPATAPGGWAETDVTTLVRQSLAQCRTWSHLLLRFAPSNAPGDGSDAYVALYSATTEDPFADPASFPRLFITYAAP